MQRGTHIVSSKIILLVDDDHLLCRVLSHQLGTRGYACDYALSSKEGLDRLRQFPQPDLIILDYCLGPREINGLGLCKAMKAGSDIPILMLTANDEVHTIVSCLDAGADQYLIKPYNLDELTARIRAVLRQHEKKANSINNSDTPFTVWRELILDSSARFLGVGKREVRLTEKEVTVLEALMHHGGEAVSRETLCQFIYDSRYEPLNRNVDVQVGRARRKLASVTNEYTILAVRGRGYRIAAKRDLQRNHDEGKHYARRKHVNT